MNDSSLVAQDEGAGATVQLAPARQPVSLVEEVAERQKLAAFFNPLQAAFDVGNVAALQSAVPGLTKKEAASLIFHTGKMRAARLSGYGPSILRYARETWGKVPPRAVVSGTAKVRMAGLLALCSGLSPADARAVVSERMAEELAELRDGENSIYGFWRFPIDTPNYGDCRAANKMLHARQAAQLAALVDYFDAPLRTAHGAAQQVLAAAGLPFELLAEWHKSGRAEVPAATS